ncbi:MAG: hypothetical protein LC105_04265 [Chitinophagales bacterium]|nr:hypothetical protein [Chitinophagales bacterium]
MSEVLRNIKDKLREITDKGITAPLSCYVVSVQDTSCTVELPGGLQLVDVRLQATVGNSQGLLLIPKVGAKALVWSVDATLNDLVLVKCDEYEKVSFQQDGLEVLIDSSSKKVSVKNDSVSLVDLFQSLYDIILQLQLNTPNGPATGATGSSISDLAQFKTDFKNLLN